MFLKDVLQPWHILILPSITLKKNGLVFVLGLGDWNVPITWFWDTKDPIVEANAEIPEADWDTLNGCEEVPGK